MMDELGKCEYCGHIMFDNHLSAHMENQHWEIVHESWLDRVAGVGTE